jgi:hypothetical protein
MTEVCGSKKGGQVVFIMSERTGKVLRSRVCVEVSYYDDRLILRSVSRDMCGNNGF